MKSTLDQLTKNEKEALARWYESDGYKALKRLRDLELVGMGADALAAPSMEQVSYLKGRAFQWKAVVEVIHHIYKESQKD